MKKYGAKLILIVFMCLLMCFTAVNLVACSAEKIEKTTPTNWQTYLDEVVNSIAKSAELNGDKFSFTLDGNFYIDQKPFTFYCAMNYDLQDLDNSLLIVELFKGKNEIFSIKSNNASTYLFIAPNDSVGDAKLKIENINLFSLINEKYNKDQQSSALEIFKTVLTNFGKAMFCDVDVNADKSIYSFEINPNLIWNSSSLVYLDTIFSMLSDDISNIFFQIFGAENKEEFYKKLPSISGKINVYMTDGVVQKLDTSLLKFGKNQELINFDIAVKVEYALQDKPISKFPKNDDGYKTTKLGSMSMSGDISLYDGDITRRAIKFGYELNINIDLMKLAFNNFDLTTLSSDNFFHFKLTHVCDNNCTEFCASKLAKTKGSVLDIAFSPKDFGAYNVYVDFALLGMMSQQTLNKFGIAEKDSANTALPAYSLITIPNSEFDGSSPIYKFIVKMFSENLFQQKDIYYTVEGLLKEFEENTFSRKFISGYMESEDFQVDNIKIVTKEKQFGQVDNYDIYKDTVYIIDNMVSELKNYDSLTIKTTQNIKTDWKFQPNQITADNLLALTNIYNASGNIMHGVEGGKYVPMSKTEVESLKGSYLKYTYNDITKSNVGSNGAQYSGTAKIIDVIGLNRNSQEVQSVKLLVECPGVFENSGIRNIFANQEYFFTEYVDADIKLTDEAVGGFHFEQTNIAEKYRVVKDAAEAPTFLVGVATIKYANGAEKQLVTRGKTSAVSTKEKIWSPDYYYSITEWGNIDVRFSVAGRTFVRNYYVEPPKYVNFDIKEENIPSNKEVGNTFYLSLLTNHAKAMVQYEDSKPIEVALQFKDFYINDISLDQNSSDWEVVKSYSTENHLSVRFLRSNVYKVVIKKMNMTSLPFKLTINAKHAGEPTYMIKDATSKIDVYRVGKEYNFISNVINKTHGEAKNNLKNFDLKIWQGSVSADNGGVTFVDNVTSNKDIVELQGFKVGETTAIDNVVENYFVPSMIIKPIKLLVDKVKFKVAGQYKIQVSMRAENAFTYVTFEWLLSVV